MTFISRRILSESIDPIEARSHYTLIYRDIRCPIALFHMSPITLFYFLFYIYFYLFLLSYIYFKFFEMCVCMCKSKESLCNVAISVFFKFAFYLYFETLDAIHLRCRHEASRRRRRKNTKRGPETHARGPRDTRGTFVRHFRTCRAIVFPSIPAWKARL